MYREKTLNKCQKIKKCARIMREAVRIDKICQAREQVDCDAKLLRKYGVRQT